RAVRLASHAGDARGWVERRGVALSYMLARVQALASGRVRSRTAVVVADAAAPRAVVATATASAVPGPGIGSKATAHLAHALALAAAPSPVGGEGSRRTTPSPRRAGGFSPCRRPRRR